MAPEERRAALVTATIPLLRECGPDVSTRRIAEAAGVAEGTIFGVFPDKQSLLVAALLHALDPQPTLDAIASIGTGAPLRERLATAAELINGRFTENAQLMTAARKLVLTADAPPEAAARMVSGRERLAASLAELIAPDAAVLRRPPETVARLLLLFCGANSYGPYGDPDHFDGRELVSLLLDGLLIRSTSTTGVPERC